MIDPRTKHLRLKGMFPNYSEIRIIKRLEWWKFWKPKFEVLRGPFPPEHLFRFNCQGRIIKC